MDAQPRHSGPAANGPAKPNGRATHDESLQIATVPQLSESPPSVEPPTVDHEERPAGEAQPFPRHFGRYELLEEVAHGGMGIVYKARDKKLGRIVALKMIRGGAFAHAEEIERFQREARAAAQLHHRHIVQIHDIGQLHGRHYFTMEFAAGGSLAQQQARFAADPRAAAALVEKVARAVAHAHANGILHRDLKPGNVLLDEHGEPLVSDFGLAKLLHADVELTQPGQQIGTPAFMAPEQFTESASSATARSDVWSLGALLYVLLTGRLPFDGRDRDTLAEQVRGVDPPSVRKLRPGLDRALETIVRKCLEKDPARRYDSAAGLADDLACWLRDEPIMARPPSRTERTWRWVRRHPWWTAGIFLLVVAPPVANYGYQHWDPDRPIKVAQRRLARGEPVELIGERGRPAWFRLETDSTGILYEANEKSSFAFHTLDVSLLELLPDSYCKSYRYSAEVQNTVPVPHGEVGIYFGRHRYMTDNGEVHRFWAVTFTDRPFKVDPDPKVPPEPRQADVTYRQFLENGIAPRTNNVRAPVGLHAQFVPVPGGVRPGHWRKLAVVVTPASLELFWDGVAQGRKSRDELMKTARNREALFDYRDDKLLVEFADSGGLGLFVNSGQASFRNVRVEPLP
jgi:serine/threonine-protein kinase